MRGKRLAQSQLSNVFIFMKMFETRLAQSQHCFCDLRVECFSFNKSREELSHNNIDSHCRESNPQHGNNLVHKRMLYPRAKPFI